MDNLVERLRNWEHVYPEDMDKPEGSLHLEAADRIEELEAKLAKAVEIADLFSGGVEYDYDGNIIGEEERKALAELEELTGGNHE